MKKLTIRLLLVGLLLAGGRVRADDAGFLFVTFKGEQTPMTEQIYFAVSPDGRNWSALNNAQPVLVSTLGEKGVRDPYLLRSHDGKMFYLIATDLSINRNGDWGRAQNDGSKSIVIWESTNLVNWTPPRLVEVAPDDAGCTWAPEAVYDESKGEYLVFWASRTGSDHFSKQRIWAAWTKDFTTFSKPFVYIDKPWDVIDTDIVREDGRYYRFSKDEQFKAITMEVSTNLMGPWTDVSGFSLEKVTGYEGPECYQIKPSANGKPATWCLILDRYSNGTGYHPFVTDDLSGGQFKPGEDFKFPFHFRHGSVLPITKAEMAHLINTWGSLKLEATSDQVKSINVVVDLDAGTVELPVMPGVDLTRLDPKFKAAFGMKVSPEGPQDFSKGPVEYQVGDHYTLKVSAVENHNPALAGYYADPDIIYSHQTGRFYIYPTSDGFRGWSGTYFKAFSSDDLVNWKDEGVILDLKKDVSWDHRNAWAPTIIEKKMDGEYKYFFYFCDAQKIGVAVADSPTGPFKDSGKPLINSRPDGVRGGQQIDPAVFHDPESGKDYLYWGNGYMAVAELNPDMTSIKQSTVKVITPDRTFREGTHVFYRKGIYYFMWSEDDTGSPNYRVRYAMAKSPTGPLEIPENNLVIARDDSAGIYGTGHNSTIQVPGTDEWYIVYHRFNYPKGITSGRDAAFHREVCIDKMEFDAAGRIIQVKPTHKGVKPVTVQIK